MDSFAWMSTCVSTCTYMHTHTLVSDENSLSPKDNNLICLGNWYNLRPQEYNSWSISKCWSNNTQIYYDTRVGSSFGWVELRGHISFRVLPGVSFAPHPSQEKVRTRHQFTLLVLRSAEADWVNECVETERALSLPALHPLWGFSLPLLIRMEVWVCAELISTSSLAPTQSDILWAMFQGSQAWGVLSPELTHTSA